MVRVSVIIDSRVAERLQ